LVSGIEQPETAVAEKSPATAENETAAPPKPNPGETKPPTIATARPLLPPKAQTGLKNTPPAPRPEATTTVTVPPEQTIVTAPNGSVPGQTAQTTATEITGMAQRSDAVGQAGISKPSQTYSQNGLTPLAFSNPAPKPLAAAPVKLVAPAPPVFPRYLYLSPTKPRAGDRNAADREFASARQAEQNRDLQAAMNSYRRAAELDPSWFEAQYDTAVMTYRLRDYSHSLAASEMALALQPDSVDARYIFALALKAAGYVTDAMSELKKIVAAHPDEARAQLALGNIYAEQMRDPDQARPHYLKWLELDPHNSQAINIRFWLSQNPP